MALSESVMSQAGFPEAYERWLVQPLFRPWAGIALDAVGLAAGERLLDVACGTGIVARVAAERVGQAGIAGVDLNPAMLAVARAAAPGIDWRQGDAAALPLRDGERFDVVTCQQGLQFFPDRPAAAAAMRRALADGGRLAASTWRPDDEIPFARELRRVAERRLGPVADQRHAFGEAEPLAALLRDAGFRDVRVRTVSRIIRFEDAAAFVRLNAMALVGMSAAGKGMTDEERRGAVEAVTDDSRPVLERYGGGPGVAFEIGVSLATAAA